MKLYARILVLLLTLGLCLCTTDCPDRWTAFDGNCYLFGHNVRRDFFEAETFCQQNGGHLVHVDNPLENAFLKAELRYLKNDNYWLGLTDVYQESHWVYYDTNKTRTFADWGPSEPNSFLGEEDCASFQYSYNYQWADVPCDMDLQPVCEISRTGHLILG